jgi:1-deoxy-D-xylulose-5-phosphate synthase
VLRRGKDVAVLAVGTMVLEAMRAAEAMAAEGIDVTVVNCRFMKPLDFDVLQEVLATHRRILTVEEGAVVNGFGAFLARELDELPDVSGLQMRTLGIPDQFVAHGNRAGLLTDIDLDAEGIAKWVRKMVGDPAPDPKRPPEVVPVASPSREAAR